MMAPVLYYPPFWKSLIIKLCGHRVVVHHNRWVCIGYMFKGKIYITKRMHHE